MGTWHGLIKCFLGEKEKNFWADSFLTYNQSKYADSVGGSVRSKSRQTIKKTKENKDKKISNTDGDKDNFKVKERNELRTLVDSYQTKPF